MKDDFTAIERSIPSEDVIKIYAVADVHIGAKEADLKGFTKFIDMVANDDNAYLVLCGDIINNATRSSVSDVYEEVLPPSEQQDVAFDCLFPVKDKIIGAVMGNHEGRSRKEVDLDPMYDVFVRLGIPELYRKSMAFIKLKVGESCRGTVYTMLLMHGKTANKTKRFAYAIEGVDILLTGHTHEGVITRPARLVFDSTGRRATVNKREIVSVTATSWLNYGGYGARNMYMPQATSKPQHIEIQNIKNQQPQARQKSYTGCLVKIKLRALSLMESRKE